MKYITGYIYIGILNIVNEYVHFKKNYSFFLIHLILLNINKQ